MKEASGEVSMTLIVIVAAAAILAIFMALRPWIQSFITQKWNNFSKGKAEIVIPVYDFYK